MEVHEMSKIGRRALLTSSLAAGISYEHRALMAQLVDRSQYGKVKEPVKGLQCGKLGKYEISRLIIGGNLISGSAHAGDHMDIVGQYQAVRAPCGVGRTYQAYDLLKSHSDFGKTFHEVWEEIFAFCAK
jgi:hypothetical protein